MPDENHFKPLLEYVSKVPSIIGPIGFGFSDDGKWWAKFAIDIGHPLAWNVVQEFGHVLNYLSVKDRLPTAFMPVSPPPYLNGDPQDFLSWIIESKETDFTPASCAEWLEGRLPAPVEDLGQWRNDDEDEASPPVQSPIT